MVMVGTNNIKSNGSEEMLKKYEELIDVAQSLKYQLLSLVSIPERQDVNSLQDSRKIGVNERLRNKYAVKTVGFIEIGSVKEHLGRDGLHLKYQGHGSKGNI